ncbi:hypothetical protein LMG19083_03394 [Ralstonia psammae]|uniref:Uncharacterized protein n=1 Tax=Ralstonia psammae TaxID=3058598 RepID=A0ABM9JQI5_9RALS|nr:hypothetical protein LMG19083_03394 [Ralstonia sp. LMG 19083]
MCSCPCYTYPVLNIAGDQDGRMLGGFRVVYLAEMIKRRVLQRKSGLRRDNGRTCQCSKIGQLLRRLSRGTHQPMLFR